MSATIERPVEFEGAGTIDNRTAQMIKRASAVRWVIQFFRDISLFDNLGPAVLNNLTLREKEEKRRGEVVRVADPVMTLRRCQPYPLTNCEYEIPLHERVRYGMSGEELPDNELPGTYAGLSPTSEGAPRHAVQSKFAYSAARELSEMYAATHGFVVLEPLTGNEDSEAVRQVFQLVQPVTYRLSALESQLTEGARERIRAAKVGKEIKTLAEGTAELMLKGARKAVATASGHMADFSRQVQQASAGHKGNRAFPVEYDEFVAEQLGVEVPRVVAVKATNSNEELLARLAERELSRGGDNDVLMAALAEIKSLKEQVAALANQKTA
jgi:hypothetical protein